jgi:SpoVK/Ycf46/Vps4 family AAA+-type ATPase
VFSLAHKLQPAIIFIDEVDSFLGQRRTTDHEAMTNMKTEFMSLWDGFTTDRKCLLRGAMAGMGSICSCSQMLNLAMLVSLCGYNHVEVM